MEQDSLSEAGLKKAIAVLADIDWPGGICPARWHGGHMPSQGIVKDIVDLSRSLIFPGFFGDEPLTCENIIYHTGIRVERLYKLLSEQIHAGTAMVQDCDDNFDNNTLQTIAKEKAEKFILALPELRRKLNADVMATYLGDPAATSTREVTYCYPGIRAISSYRIAHKLVQLQVPIIPRMISELAHSETGIDIHPEATIGESFTIDHGTGIVIGATAIIGNNVKLYQGVTLGAKSFDTDLQGNPIKGIPRHPIIGDNVVIYSNTTILGRIKIGNNAVIGGNIWITEDVADNEKLVQAKANNILRFKK